MTENLESLEDRVYSREHVPIGQLLKRQEIGCGDMSPRVYQIELFERAKAENTIAVLDTGLACPLFELIQVN